MIKFIHEPRQVLGWFVSGHAGAIQEMPFARLLFGLHESAAGRAMLERLPVSGFQPATEETYRPVRDFLEKYSKTVRQIEYPARPSK